MEETISCQNCHFVFSDFEALTCPRCNSKHLLKRIKHSKSSTKQHSVQVRYKSSTQRIFGDTKEAWKNFHSSEISICPQCGGMHFSLDFKHKEKVCSNCGAVLSLRRR